MIAGVPGMEERDWEGRRLRIGGQGVDVELPWERLDRVDALRDAVG